MITAVAVADIQRQIDTIVDEHLWELNTIDRINLIAVQKNMAEFGQDAVNKASHGELPEWLCGLIGLCKCRPRRISFADNGRLIKVRRT
jgi:hypothetical protein